MCEVLNDNVGTLNVRLPIPPRPSRGVGLGVADGCVGSRPSMFTVVGFTGCSVCRTNRYQDRRADSRDSHHASGCERCPVGSGGWAGCVWSVPLEGPGGWCAEE